MSCTLSFGREEIVRERVRSVEKEERVGEHCASDVGARVRIVVFRLLVGVRSGRAKKGEDGGVRRKFAV